MADQQGSFKISIGVIDDEAIKKLKDINSQLYKAQAPIRAYQRELKKFNDLTGRTANLKKLTAGIDGLKSKFSQITGVIGGMGKTLLGIIGIGSIAGVIALTRSFANWGNELRNASALLGITKDKVIQLNQMTKLSGSSDQAQQALTYQDAQEQVKYGRDAAAAQADNILGINPNMSMEDAQIKASRVIRDKLKNHQIDQYGARELARLSGVGNIVLERTPEELEKLQRQAKANAREMSGFADSAAKLRDTMAEASARVDVLKTELAASLSPVITPLIQKFIDWSKDNKKVTDTFNQISAAAKKLGDWISKLDINKVKDGFDKAVGVGKTLLEVFLAIQALKFTSWAVSLVKDIGTVISAITKLTTSTTAATEAMTIMSTPATAILGGVVVGAAGAAAAYGVGSAITEIHKDFYTPGGVLEGRKDRMKDPRYGPNWEDPLTNSQDQYRLMNYMVDKEHLSPVQAAGIIAQAQGEQRLNPQGVGDNGHAIGMFGWHEDREAAIEKKAGKDVTAMTQEEQIHWFIDELRTKETDAGKSLANATDIRSATIAGLKSERPQDWLDHGADGAETLRRTRYAMAASQQWNKTHTVQIDVNDHREIKVTQPPDNPNTIDVRKNRIKGGNTQKIL